MRIAVVSPYGLDAPGGVQDQVLGIAAGLRERGHAAWVVAPGSDESDAPVEHVGRVVRVPANRSKSPIALGPAVPWRVRRAIAAADVVHVHEPFMPLVGWVAMSTTARLVLTFHADPSPLIRACYRAAAPLVRRLVGRAEAVTAVSPVASSVLVPLGIEPQVIPNAVSMPEEVGAEPRNAHRVAFLGRDEPRKGLDVLLEAWPHVIAQIPDAELVVMGASRREVPTGVSTVGIVDAERKWSTLASSAVLCAPNLGGESFGITLVEGMAAGCAVVASRLPAFLDVVGDAGELVPVGDSRALAKTLVDLLGNPLRRKALAAAAERRAVRYSWTPVLDAYETLLLGTGGSSGTDSP